MMRKTVLNLALPDDIVERIKNTVFNSEGWTMGEFVAAACNKALAEIEKQHGGPFAERTGNMRKGPQSYTARTALCDLSDWIETKPNPPDNEQAILSFIQEVVSGLAKQPSFGNLAGVAEEVEAALRNKLLDVPAKPRVKRKNEATTKETTNSLPGR